MKYIITAILLGVVTIGVFGQDGLINENAGLKWAESIDSNDMKRHLFYLASDYLEGRETGQPGNQRAAEYAADFFSKHDYKAIDEDGDYFQEITFTQFQPDTTIFTLGGRELTHFEDFVVSPFRQRPLTDSNIDKLHFAGYGLENGAYSDYGSYDWKDKTILIYHSVPDKIASLVIDSTQLELNERLLKAEEKGVKAVFIIHDKFSSYASRNKRYLLSGFLNLGKVQPDSLPLLPHAAVTTELAKQMVDKKYKKFIKERDELLENGGLKGKPLTVPVDIKLEWQPKLKFIKSNNVVAYLPGDHPDLKNEYIVVSAHYDHLGERADEVYNGADDNASGTTTVLELAETFAEARSAGIKLDRSLLFILMTGEEKGLLGSRYYADHPLLPLDNAVANVNIDMVGRIDQKYQDSLDYIYVIGADRISPELHEINELANKRGPDLVLDYTYNEENDPNRYYYRSDHYNFAKKGIPAIFYFNGTHEDYHRITDTPDKIEFSAMKERGELFFLTIWELLQRPERLEILNSTK